MSRERPSTTRSAGPWRRALREFRARRSSVWALRFLLLLGVASILVPLLPFAAPAELALDAKLASPSLKGAWRDGFDPSRLHAPGPLTSALVDARVAIFDDGQIGPLLGRDALGRCLLSRLAWGARLSLAVGLVASVISLLIGVLWGAISGYAGGRTDDAMMRIVDVLYALPLMFIVIFVVALLRGFRNEHPELEANQVVVLFAVIGATSWLTMARIVRGQVLSLREAEFIDAARACGSTQTAILARHVIPNVTPVVIVTLTLTIPRVMLFEAFLSFLGLGVEAPDVSWGVLARQGFDALTAVHTSWWLIVFPGLAFACTLLAMNVLGDGLRDALDPRLRGTRS